MFGWGKRRKASKCKKLIKQVQSKLEVLKKRRYSMVRHLREDVGQLIQTGHEKDAFIRVECIIEDESMAAVYELLGHFCESILLHLSKKDCRNDINEAVSSLVYASARCRKLPELLAIRKLFGERYGQEFVVTAVELHPGNLVNPEIIERLSQKSVPYDMKQRKMDEIAKDYCQKAENLALEYYPELHQHQLEANENKGTRMTASSSESFLEHLNEIEEFQSTTTKDEYCQDQTLFKFTLSALPKSEKSCSGECHHCCFRNGESDEEMEMKGEAERSNAPPCSIPRAKTMPPERPKNILQESMVRSISFPVQYPNHVHPKLPDYEDLVSKLMASKKEAMLNKAEREKELSEKISELNTTLRDIEEEKIQLNGKTQEYQEKINQLESALNQSALRNSELEDQAYMNYQRNRELEDLILISHSKVEDSGKNVSELELLLKTDKYRIQELEEQISTLEKKCADSNIGELASELEAFQAKASSLEIALQTANEKEREMTEFLKLEILRRIAEALYNSNEMLRNVISRGSYALHCTVPHVNTSNTMRTFLNAVN